MTHSIVPSSPRIVARFGRPQSRLRRSRASASPARRRRLAFASTPRGYRFVELENGAVPEVGRLLEVPDVGVLVVLRHGPSPLPADERVCVFLEPVVPTGVSV